MVFSRALQQLMDEHASLRAEMDLFYEITEEIACDSGPHIIQRFARLQELVVVFTDRLKAHSKREEIGLFPMMSFHLGENDRTIEVMEFEHEKAKRHLQDFRLEANQLNSTIDEISAHSITVYAVQAYTTLIEHFAKEERVLFPLAEDTLSFNEKKELELLHSNP